MKIIIFLVLAGLSLAQEDLQCQKKTVDDRACVIYAIENSRDFMKTFTIYLCDYKGLFDDNTKNYNETSEDLIQTLACAGCGPDGFLSNGNTFEDLLGNAAKRIKEIGKPVGRIADILDFTQPITDFICYLEGEALTSECATKILQRDVPEDVDKLNKLFCESDFDALSEHEIITLWSDLDCLGDDALHTGDAMENLLKKVAGEEFKKALRSIVDELKKLLLTSDIIQKLSCDVTKVVLGEESLSGFIPLP
ncbi:uncharacterized protein LOC130281804 [Hyla sarda]|uniref:uncharacterized protein LOC130281804 n=1 Tax=Hyla sarda TaxID=327740 RepID=UPI0024C245AE|nr:uncharacterized protein LOC130281804 [Hyla sarda]